MLHVKPTQKGTGIELFGHHDDLESLYETVHYLCGDTQAESEQHEHALSFAYELRKSFERCRGIRQSEYGELYGTQHCWPYILFYTSYFRHLAAYRPTNKLHQSNLMQLEYAVESALIEYDAKIGAEIIDLYRGIGDVAASYQVSFVEEIMYEFLYLSASGKMRFRRLPALIKAMYPMSSQYQSYADRVQRIAKKYNCSPEQLTDDRQWPEIKW
jgi:hypothetical protein